MKRTRTKLAALAVTVLLAQLCIITCFNGLSQKAYADFAPDKFSCQVYYFSDYYPTLSESDIQEECGNVSVYYDFQYVNEQGLENLINQGHFNNLGSAQTAVIDIKTFRPDDHTLGQLFGIVKPQVSNLMFISAYPSGDYGDTTFGGYVNSFIYDNCAKLDWFVKKSLNSIGHTMGGLIGTAFLFDNKTVDPAIYEKDNFNIYELNEICQNSPFIRILLEQLASVFGIAYVPGNYNQIAVELFNIWGIRLLVHKIGNSFIDIRDGSLTYVSTGNQDKVCAMGFWTLNSDFYNFLKTKQTGNSANNMQIYIIEAEPITYAPGGLEIITVSDLEAWFGDFVDENTMYALNVLSSWL